MKIIKYIVVFSFIVCVSNIIHSQEEGRLTKKGDKLFDNYAYYEAIEIYLRAVEKDEKSLNLYANLADSYYQNTDMENAVKWYETLMNFDLPSVKGEYYFRYSQALKAVSDYENSDLWLNKLAELNADDTRANSLKFDPDYLNEIEQLSYRYTIAPTSINTEFSEFATGFTSNGVMFASDKAKKAAVKRTHAWTGNSFLELFSAEITPEGDLINDKRFKSKFNSKYNESSIAVSKDENTIYFTRNSYNEGYQKDEEGIIRLKLYIAKKDEEGRWNDVIEFPYNDINHSVAHPSLSHDGKTLYFASDMPGGKGLSDIYSVSVNEDGSFGTPINLGDKINTEGRDTFPFISKTGDLYFASDGHLGLGGLDVFIAPNFEEVGGVDEIYNTGKPINSKKDDFAFVINDDSKLGFFTSNRDEGLGSDDIYRLEEIKPLIIECSQNISGKVIDKNTREFIANADVTIYDKASQIIHNLRSDAQGNFNFDVDCIKEATYRAVGEKIEYKSDTKDFTVNPPGDTKLELALELEPKPAEVGTDLFKLLDLNPIYFDYDKSFIRNDAEIELKKVINYMKEYPTVKIDVRSHTDSRGRDQYNLDLSQRRNVSTIDYIVSVGGISRSRITGRGYGETQLLNRCSNGVKCTKDEHQLNRRSEFIVVDN